MADQASDRELKNALAQIEKQFGKGAIMQLGDDVHQRRARASPPAPSSLDIALGGKGLPRGRIIEIFGPESSGKTTIALHAVANAQKAGRRGRLHRRRARPRPDAGPSGSAWTWKACWSASRPTARRR